MLDKGVTIRGGRSLDTPDRRTSLHGHHSTSSSKRHHHSHQPYRSEYFLEEFKKFKPSTFDGEMKKLEDEKAWFLGMNKFFRLHSCSENMKPQYPPSVLKGKQIFGGNM